MNITPKFVKKINDSPSIFLIEGLSFFQLEYLYNRLTFYFLKVKRDEDDKISSPSL